MSRIFISDLHLESDRDSKFRVFKQVLETAIDHNDEVFILGDLVDVWVGDDDDSPFAEALIRELRSTAEHTPLHVMQGNRDFLYQDAFASQTGAVLISDPCVLERNDLPEKVLLAHGDAYCTSDNAYMKMRQLLRSPEWQDQILSSTLEERRALARSLREQSKVSNQLKAANITDVVETEIESDLKKHDCKIMIHGHTHRPGIHNLQSNAKRMVLGDWNTCGWLLRQRESAFTLERFAI